VIQKKNQFIDFVFPMILEVPRVVPNGVDCSYACSRSSNPDRSLDLNKIREVGFVLLQCFKWIA